jgi:hypothetical protein
MQSKKMIRMGSTEEGRRIPDVGGDSTHNEEGVVRAGNGVKHSDV